MSLVAWLVLVVILLCPLSEQVSVIGGLACTGCDTSVPIIRTGQRHWWPWLVLVMMLLYPLLEQVSVIGGLACTCDTSVPIIRAGQCHLWPGLCWLWCFCANCRNRSFDCCDFLTLYNLWPSIRSTWPACLN